MTINTGQLKAWFTYAIGLGAAGYAAYLTVASSPTKAAPAAIAAAVLLGVERYVADPSTGEPDATWTNTPTVKPADKPTTTDLPSFPA